MNYLTPELNKLLRDKIEGQYLQFSKNLGRSDDYESDIFDKWVITGGELFKARVLAVIDSLTFDESDIGDNA